MIKKELVKETRCENSMADEILRVALDIGAGILRSGGEIHRVEDTVTRICKAYGAEHIEIFAIPSALMAAVRLKNGEYSSQIRRIDSVSNNLGALEEYNSVSRKICKETPEISEVDKLIAEAKKRKNYSKWMRALGSSVAAASFAIFFGGSVLDAVSAGIIGILIYLIDTLPIKQVNRMAKTVIQSFAAGFLSILFVKIGLGSDAGMIMIGTVMLLIPGIFFGTAFRDLLCGDFLAGTLKTVQCILAALMIAAGYLLAIFLMGGAI